MKKLLLLITVAAAALAACNEEKDTWEKYADWREQNATWLNELQSKKDADGKPYYSTIIPAWDPAAFVLIHYYGDPQANADKLSPIHTSTIDVRYRLHLCTGEAVDSSANVTTDGVKGIFRTQLKSTIAGWGIAMPHVHCGDSVELIVPYNVGYDDTDMGAIPPYSNLRFNIRLVDIHDYERNPN